MVHGKPRHSQSQGSVERANRDVENKLACWLRDNKPKSWVEGLGYVQFSKNSSHHSGISCSPYAALFGCPPKCGILDLNIPTDRLAVLQSEEDLEVLLQNSTKTASTTQYDNENETSNTSNNIQLHVPEENGAAGKVVTSPQRDGNDENPFAIILHNTDSHKEYSETSDPGILDQNPTFTPDEADRQNEVIGDFEFSEDCVCAICDLEVGQADGKCFNCSNWIHYDERCSVVQETLTEPIPVRFCIICKNKCNVIKMRANARSSLKRQAKKMLGDSNKRLKPAGIGDCVVVPVPDVDRGRGDHRNVKAVILSVEDGFYKIGTESGKLNGFYTRNQFSTCDENLMEIDSVPENEISLRQAAQLTSSGTGQGFFFCRCRIKCSGRCKCMKNERLCISKCHSNKTCTNK